MSMYVKIEDRLEMDVTMGYTEEVATNIVFLSDSITTYVVADEDIQATVVVRGDIRGSIEAM